MFELHLGFDLVEARIDGGHTLERRLSDLAGCFSDQDAYAESLTTGDCLVYRVSSPLEPGSAPGDLHFGLGMLMPGQIGNEYFLTKGHLHKSREAAEVYICLSEGVFELLSSNDRSLFYAKRSPLVPTRHDQERLAWTLDCYPTRCMSRFIRVI